MSINPWNKQRRQARAQRREAKRQEKRKKENATQEAIAWNKASPDQKNTDELQARVIAATREAQTKYPGKNQSYFASTTQLPKQKLPGYTVVDGKGDRVSFGVWINAPTLPPEKKEYSLSGRVLGPKNHLYNFKHPPIPGADVTLTLNSRSEVKSTDGEGAYYFDKVQGGLVYELQAKKVGYKDSKVIRGTLNKDDTQDIILDNNPKSLRTNSILVVVKADNGSGGTINIEDADVSFKDSQDKTTRCTIQGRGGAHEYPIENLPPGPGTLTVSREEYNTHTEPILIPHDDPIQVTLTLFKPGTHFLKGKVTEEGLKNLVGKAKPIDKVEITLRNINNDYTYPICESKSDGSYNIELEEGVYQLTASKVGYEEYKPNITIEIKKGEAIHNFTMKKDPKSERTNELEVEVIVREDDGNVLRIKEVTLNFRDSQGYNINPKLNVDDVRFIFKNLPPGIGKLTVTKEGYEPSNQDITIPHSEIVVVELKKITSYPPGSIEGFVYCEEKGKKVYLNDVKITVNGKSDTTKKGALKSNKTIRNTIGLKNDGYYFIDNIPSKTAFTITAEHVPEKGLPEFEQLTPYSVDSISPGVITQINDLPLTRINRKPHLELYFESGKSQFELGEPMPLVVNGKDIDVPKLIKLTIFSSEITKKDDLNPDTLPITKNLQEYFSDSPHSMAPLGQYTVKAVAYLDYDKKGKPIPKGKTLEAEITFEVILPKFTVSSIFPHEVVQGQANVNIAINGFHLDRKFSEIRLYPENDESRPLIDIHTQTDNSSSENILPLGMVSIPKDAIIGKYFLYIKDEYDIERTVKDSGFSLSGSSSPPLFEVKPRPFTITSIQISYKTTDIKVPQGQSKEVIIHGEGLDREFGEMILTASGEEPIRIGLSINNSEPDKLSKNITFAQDYYHVGKKYSLKLIDNQRTESNELIGAIEITGPFTVTKLEVGTTGKNEVYQDAGETEITITGTGLEDVNGIFVYKDGNHILKIIRKPYDQSDHSFKFKIDPSKLHTNEASVPGEYNLEVGNSSSDWAKIDTTCKLVLLPPKDTPSIVVQPEGYYIKADTTKEKFKYYVESTGVEYNKPITLGFEISASNIDHLQNAKYCYRFFFKNFKKADISKGTPESPSSRLMGSDKFRQWNPTIKIPTGSTTINGSSVPEYIVFELNQEYYTSDVKHKKKSILHLFDKKSNSARVVFNFTPTPIVDCEKILVGLKVYLLESNSKGKLEYLRHNKEPISATAYYILEFKKEEKKEQTFTIVGRVVDLDKCTSQGLSVGASAQDIYGSIKDIGPGNSVKEIRLCDSSGNSKSDFKSISCDSQGKFIFDKVPVGEYSIAVRAEVKTSEGNQVLSFNNIASTMLIQGKNRQLTYMRPKNESINIKDKNPEPVCICIVTNTPAPTEEEPQKEPEAPSLSGSSAPPGSQPPKLNFIVNRKMIPNFDPNGMVLQKKGKQGIHDGIDPQFTIPLIVETNASTKVKASIGFANSSSKNTLIFDNTAYDDKEPKVVNDNNAWKYAYATKLDRNQETIDVIPNKRIPLVIYLIAPKNVENGVYPFTIALSDETDYKTHPLQFSVQIFESSEYILSPKGVERYYNFCKTYDQDVKENVLKLNTFKEEYSAIIKELESISYNIDNLMTYLQQNSHRWDIFDRIADIFEKQFVPEYNKLNTKYNHLRGYISYENKFFHKYMVLLNSILKDEHYNDIKTTLFPPLKQEYVEAITNCDKLVSDLDSNFLELEKLYRKFFQRVVAHAITARKRVEKEKKKIEDLDRDELRNLVSHIKDLDSTQMTALLKLMFDSVDYCITTKQKLKDDNNTLLETLKKNSAS